MSAAAKILTLSHRNVAAILTASVAFLIFSALIWISERSESESSAKQTPHSNSNPPVMPVSGLPPSGMEGMGAMPPPRR